MILAALNPPVPLPDSILWWHVALMILFGGAISTFFLDLKAHSWVKNGVFETKKVIFWMDICAYIQCGILGALVGYTVWHWVLGMAFGLLGSFGNAFFMMIVRHWLKKKGYLNGASKSDSIPEKLAP